MWGCVMSWMALLLLMLGGLGLNVLWKKLLLGLLNLRMGIGSLSHRLRDRRHNLGNIRLRVASSRLIRVVAWLHSGLRWRLRDWWWWRMMVLLRL